MWPNHDETIELLNGAQQGDRDAVDRLLDRHRDSLNRMVRCRLNPGVARRVDASDVVFRNGLEESVSDSPCIAAFAI